MGHGPGRRGRESAGTDGQFTLLEATEPPNFGPPMHIHRDASEAFYVLEGEYLIFIDDVETASRAPEPAIGGHFGVSAKRDVGHLLPLSPGEQITESVAESGTTIRRRG